MDDTEGFVYPPPLDDGALLTHREIKRATYKGARGTQDTLIK